MPPGWEEFNATVNFLHEGGDRAMAAEGLRYVATHFPDSDYAVTPEEFAQLEKQGWQLGPPWHTTEAAYRLQRPTPIDSEELADLLDEMAEEDRAWVEPEDRDQLTTEQRIQYAIYHLRNVDCYQSAQPSCCDLLNPEEQRSPRAYNAAIDLLSLGEPGIPALLELLDDRRPTRSVGYWRMNHPSCTVLRYQDAAIQILNELLPVAFYYADGTSAYLSNVRPKEREAMITQVLRWYAYAEGKSPEEQKWLAIKYGGIWTALTALETLASDPEKKERAIAELHGMFKTRHWVYQPQIVHVMAELGDTSKVTEVIKHHLAGKYRTVVGLPDDRMAGYYAQDYAESLFKKYGTKNSVKSESEGATP